MIPIYWIDAFTETPFSGNPAAVCLLESMPSDAAMQALATELQLSETAFVCAEGPAFRLRWFTPACEVKLCGHATLASAAALLDASWSRGSEAIYFQTLSGELRAWRRKDDGLLELDFPERMAELAPAPEGALEALGIKNAECAKAGEDWLIALGSEEEVRALRPDFRRLALAGGRGFCVTAKSNSGDADFVSRFFGPAVGVDEDPVTGSAHCYLGPWWAERLGRSDLSGRQLSARGGMIRVNLKHGRAFLRGAARMVFKGQVAEGLLSGH
jgi:PhzF family phenazine biosynthesis protein